MARYVSEGNLALAEELKSLARGLRQGKYDIPTIAKATPGYDIQSLFNEFFAEDEDSTVEDIDNYIRLLKNYHLYIIFVDKQATPILSGHTGYVAVAEPKQSERMSPAQQRLADLLGKDKAGTQSFIQAVFKLTEPNTKLGDITRAVKSYVSSRPDIPKPEQIAALLKSTSGPREKPSILNDEPAEESEVKERRHVSVWEIRN